MSVLRATRTADDLSASTIALLTQSSLVPVCVVLGLRSRMFLICVQPLSSSQAHLKAEEKGEEFRKWVSTPTVCTVPCKDSCRKLTSDGQKKMLLSHVDGPSCGPSSPCSALIKGRSDTWIQWCSAVRHFDQYVQLAASWSASFQLVWMVYVAVDRRHVAAEQVSRDTGLAARAPGPAWPRPTACPTRLHSRPFRASVHHYPADNENTGYCQLCLAYDVSPRKRCRERVGVVTPNWTKCDQKSNGVDE